jgi:imidazolonepropionase-like amidohydrolase
MLEREDPVKSKPYVNRRMASFAVVVGLMCLAGVASSQGLGGGESCGFIHATVIDGTGAAARVDQTIIVSQNHISAVGTSGRTTIAPGIRVIDATGQFLIPGLWDAHVHTRYKGIDHLRLLIASGITSARDMGGPWQHLKEIHVWREQIGQGQRVGPRIIAPGSGLDGPGSPWSHTQIVSGPDEGRQVVRRLKREGADFVKVNTLLSRESFLAIADEAKLTGLPFVGHVPRAITVSEASDAGQRSIEHLQDILFATSARGEELMKQSQEGRVSLNRDSLSVSKVKALADQFRRNQIRVVPTLSLDWTALEAARRDPVIVEADRLRYIPMAYKDEWKRAQTGSVESLQRLFDKEVELVRELHRSGVELLAGTDVVKPFFVPGPSLHDELSLLVKAGLSPMEALEAATRNPARFLGLKDVGTIEPGMVADLVLLDANPLQNIENTQRIATVVAAGRLIEKRELQIMLGDIQQMAAQWTGTPTGR